MQSIPKPYSHLGLAVLMGLGMSLIVFVMLGSIPRANADNHTLSPSSTAYTNTLFLPIVFNQPLCDVSGHATLNSAPAKVTLQLLQSQFIDLTPIYTITTGTDGGFCFQNVPVLSSCGADYGYYVRFKNDSGNPDKEYAAYWSTNLLSRCSASQMYTNVQAELSDIIALTPQDAITTTLPVTFSWLPLTGMDANYFLFIGSACSPIHMGQATTYVFNTRYCEKPWLPTRWWIMAKYANGFKDSQEHSLMIQW
jgi:hypothetical protein